MQSPGLTRKVQWRRGEGTRRSWTWCWVTKNRDCRRIGLVRGKGAGGRKRVSTGRGDRHLDSRRVSKSRAHLWVTT